VRIQALLFQLLNILALCHRIENCFVQ